MSVSNRSVNRNASTEELEAKRASYVASLEKLDGTQDDLAEWLESGIEIIDDELAERKGK